MMPGLKGLFGPRGERLEEAADRHVEHFNAHPYLAGIALGAALRLEADGESPETIRRFKTAVRGPLGGLGDTLVWATWLPVVSMVAIALYWLGFSATVAAGLFLVVYNIGHVGLRLWGFVVGLEAGRNVAGPLAAARFQAWTVRLRAWGVVVVGVVLGALLGGPGGFGDAGVPWTVLGVAGFLVGLRVGHHVWRPAAVAVVGAIAIIATWGILV
jgi:mannose/fructose/N-acetylgalactosamine-specific phosphotransferase system component IID